MDYTFDDGYNAHADLVGANAAVLQGNDFHSFVGRVDDVSKEGMKAILESRMKKDGGGVKGAGFTAYHKTFKGFYAENHHAATFNLNAEANGSDLRAIVLHSNGENSVDIEIVDGSGSVVERIQSKCSSTAAGAKRALDAGNYDGQTKLVCKGQTEDIHGSVDHIEVTDKDGKTVKSDAITAAEADAGAQKLLDEGDIDKKKHSVNAAIGYDRIVAEALKAGLSAAVVSIALAAAPKICEIIGELLREGDVDPRKFKELGFDALTAGPEAFLRGTLASALIISCCEGVCGEQMKALVLKEIVGAGKGSVTGATIIGAVIALVMDTIKNAGMLALGKITKQEFVDGCIRSAFVAAFSTAAGIGVAALCPPLAAFGYMIGSFVGSVVGAAAYKGLHSCTMAFCIESGFTLFGLVEQDYELPMEILKKIGLEVFDYGTVSAKKFEYSTYQPRLFEYKTQRPTTVDITFLRRGVIGVNTIGYLV